MGTLLLVGYKLQPSNEKLTKKTSIMKLIRRIDGLGALSLSGALCSFLLFLDGKGKEKAWSSPYIIMTGVSTLSLALIFCFVEAYFAKEPLFPITLLTNRDVATIYYVLGLTTGSQIAFTSTVAVYFILTFGVSNTNAASRLVLGNIAHGFGGLTSGYIITRTGRYKRVLAYGVSFGLLGYTLITLRWRGHTNIFETTYLAICGYAIGSINTSAFVALTASVNKEEQAIATAGFYLSDNLGFITITSIGNAVLQSSLNYELMKALAPYPDRLHIIKNILSNINNIRNLPSEIHDKAIHAFVVALQWDHSVSVLSCAIALLLTIFILREYALDAHL